VRIFFFLLFALSLGAKELLPPLEQKLFTFIKQTQITEHERQRYRGTWPTYPKYSGVRKEIPESNSFMTLQTIVLLEQVNQDYELQGVDAVFSLADEQIQKYVTDASQTNEVNGTISFWPLIQTDDGEWIRSFDTMWYNRSMRILNVGNDFDSSSQAFAWFYMRNQNREFLDAFVQSVSLYVDEDRQGEHPLNEVWKSKDSGAFLTWAETEAPEQPINRIMDLVNDVDCVVNLNILTSLSYYENYLDPLPKETAKARDRSCKLIQEVIQNEEEDRCGTWYTRPSHFYLAFAKAYQADTFCLSDEKEEIFRRTKARAKYLLKHPKMRAYTEIAELLITLKSLTPKRTYFFKQFLSDLEIQLREGIVEKDNYAYLPSKHSLFGGQAFGMFHFSWYGRANATALALRALSMK